MSKVKSGSKIKKSKQDWVIDIVIYTVSILILFVTLYPFYYVFMLSFNEGMDASLGGIYWFPRKFTLENYSSFFTDWKWVRGLAVSVARTLLGTTLGVLFTTLVAYGMSFKDLIGRKAYMTFIIVCMYFSGGIIPYYMVLKSLHLIDSFSVYIIPGMLHLLYITIGRSFFEGIPESLRESAKIDGASELTVFTKIIIPISKPFMATLALYIGVGHWNNWYDSTFFVKTKELRTLPYLMMEIINKYQTSASDVNAALHQTSSTTGLSIQLRYRLLPYIYTLAANVYNKNATIMRSLLFDFMDDPEVKNISDQYMFGPSLLVCPVTEPMYYEVESKPLQKEKFRNCYLPAGTSWYNFHTGEKMEGGQYIQVKTYLDTIPVFVREGSVIPMAEGLSYADEIAEKDIHLVVYPGKDVEFELYEDEGDNYNYEQGKCSRIPLFWIEENQKLTIGERKGEFSGMKKERKFIIRCGQKKTEAEYKGEKCNVYI